MGKSNSKKEKSKESTKLYKFDDSEFQSERKYNSNIQMIQTKNKKNSAKDILIIKENIFEINHSKKNSNDIDISLNKLSINLLSKDDNYCISNNRNLITVGGSLKDDIRKYYKIEEVIKGGTFGTVRKGYKKNDETKCFAIKSMIKSNLSKQSLDCLVKEVEILSTLDHPNIIKFIETYNDQYYFHIVMELCKGKEVNQRFFEDNIRSEDLISKIIFKVTKALNYCHSLGVTHRDIKPENILFESKDNESEIKLIDFGLSKMNISNERMHTILGSPYFVSPDVLNGNYDEKCDIWSLGATTYFLISGEYPFNGTNRSDIFNKIINEELLFNDKWLKISESCKDFIKKCMMKDAQDRLTAYRALEHPWLKKVDKEIHSLKTVDPNILLSLKYFSHPKTFKKIVLKFLVNSISSNDLIRLRKYFVTIDTHNTGFIEFDEFTEIFRISNLDFSQEELYKIFSNLDYSKIGKINYSEFLSACMDKKSSFFKDKLILAFKFFDVNADGQIDSDDLKKALLKSGKSIINYEEFQKIIQECNNNKDTISEEEFINIFENEN